MDIILTIPDEGKRILESWLGKKQIQPWVQHAINNKLRQRLDASIAEQTEFNPQKLTEVEKYALLKGVTLPTREKRDGIATTQKDK